MKDYCLDTSGLITPLEFMPEDIHPTLWTRVRQIIIDDRFAVTTEIYEELAKLPGTIGQCITDNKARLQLEIEEDTWDWQTYIEHVARMRDVYESVISENNGNRKNTIGFNDVSIIALAKTLGLPLISSERKLASTQDSAKRQKIPDVCEREDIEHMSFNDLLRAEGITT